MMKYLPHFAAALLLPLPVALLAAGAASLALSVVAR